MPRKSNAPVCVFYQRGTCNKGNHCRFSHTDVISAQDQVLCQYHILGKCRYGDNCHLLHGVTCTFCNKPCLHPYNNELSEAHIRICQEETSLLSKFPADIIAASKTTECGICLDTVVEKGRKFGLMTSCDHSFCLQCILEWRNKSKDATNASTMVKSCPTCRQESLYIIPSAVFCIGDHKTHIIKQYKDSLRNTPCKHFTRTGNCPFGADCFFAHLDGDGLPVDSSKMKNIVKNRPARPSMPFGSDIIDLLSHVTNMHPSNVMDLLMDLLVDEIDDWEI